MRASKCIPTASRAYAAVLLLALSDAALGDPPAAADNTASSGSAATGTQSSTSSGGIFSSLKQAFAEDLRREVVRGHFDVGSPPDTHRFYCLVDAKTGKAQANGVAGDPFVRPDGMTGIKNGAVGPVSCAKVEQEGNLVTVGYVLKVTPQSAAGATSTANVPPPPAPPPASLPAPPPPQPASTHSAPERIDVAGIRLGMSPDQVRSILKSRMLSDYFESTESLDGTGGAPAAARANVGGRYVNVIAAWTPDSSASAGDTARGDGESYEIMFTPVPGRERVMAIVHSTAYASAHAIQTAALQNGLIAKYGAYGGPNELTDSPTWRMQSNGTVLAGDTCGRRGVVGGLGGIEPHSLTPQNLALKTTPDEFRFQIDRCGVAIVTEDQSTANGDTPIQNRTVTKFTVTAYSPSIAFDGATTAAQLIQASGSSSARAQAPSRELSTPNL